MLSDEQWGDVGCEATSHLVFGIDEPPCFHTGTGTLHFVLYDKLFGCGELIEV